LEKAKDRRVAAERAAKAKAEALKAKAAALEAKSSQNTRLAGCGACRRWMIAAVQPK
jgi:hypothetical protein